MKVDYKSVDVFPGWESWSNFILGLLDMGCPHSVLEIGSGHNPTLSREVVISQRLRYVLNDVSSTELAKAKVDYETLTLDFSQSTESADLFQSFDCIFSRMVGEHVSNGHIFHRNIFGMLQPGGIAVHCFSTLWTLPFFLNHILPEKLSYRLLRKVAPRNEDPNLFGKFSAHYDWCRGPSKGMITQLESIGFEVLEYTGYFGHRYYAPRMPLLHRLENEKTAWLLKFPHPAFCSYATVVLRKPSIR